MLDGPLLLPPVVLAGLLALSGIAKLRHPEEVHSAFRELELPHWLTSSPAPRVLPWVELVLAVLLLAAPAPFALPVAVAVLALCLAYLGVIVRGLRLDHPVACSCFGRLGVGEVTRRTAARNVLLVLLAALALWSATAEMPVLARLIRAPAPVWVWLLLTLLTGGLLALTFGAPTKGGPAPAPGDADEDYRRAPIPFASLVDGSGTTVPLSDLVRDGAHLLVFVSTTCASCREAIAAVPEWDRRLGPVRVSAVTWHPVDTVVREAPGLAGHLLQDPGATTARIFRVGTPGAVLLGGDGMLAGGPVQGGAEVHDFVEDVHSELLEAGVLPEDGSASVGE